VLAAIASFRLLAYKALVQWKQAVLSFIEFAELALNILLEKMNRKVTSPMADSDQSDIREEMTVESLKNN
jgi:hypothetical protein